MKILKKVIITLAFPVLMFLVMLLITANTPQCYVGGKLIFIGSGLMKWLPARDLVYVWRLESGCN